MSNILTHKITYVKIKFFSLMSQNIDVTKKNELFIQPILLNMGIYF